MNKGAIRNSPASQECHRRSEVQFLCTAYSKIVIDLKECLECRVDIFRACIRESLVLHSKDGYLSVTVAYSGDTALFTLGVHGE